MTIPNRPAPAPQDHFIKMVTCNLAGAGALGLAGGFSGNYLLVASAGLQLVANGLFIASKFEKTLGEKRCAQLQGLAFKLFTINSACAVASGLGLGNFSNPFGFAAPHADIVGLGLFGFAGGVAGMRTQDPSQHHSKLTDLLNPRVIMSRAGRQQWVRGLNRNKAAAFWYNISSIAPVIGGTIGVTAALIAGAPATVVAGAALTLTAGIGYMLGNAALCGSTPKPRPATTWPDAAP